MQVFIGGVCEMVMKFIFGGAALVLSVSASAQTVWDFNNAKKNRGGPSEIAGKNVTAIASSTGGLACKAGDICADTMTFVEDGISVEIDAKPDFDVESAINYFVYNDLGAGGKVTGLGVGQSDNGVWVKGNSDNVAGDASETDELLTFAFSEGVNLDEFYVFGGEGDGQGHNVMADGYEFEVTVGAISYTVETSNGGYLDLSGIDSFGSNFALQSISVDSDTPLSWYLGGMKVSAPLNTSSALMGLSLMGFAVIRRRK